MPSRAIITRRSLLAALALVLAAGAAGWRPAYADSIVHVVQPGEDLVCIGLRYGVTWIDIMQANNLPNTTIFAGQQLAIPVAGPAPVGPVPTAEPTQPTAAAPTEAPAPGP